MDSVCEEEAERSLQIQDQVCQHIELLSQKQNKMPYQDLHI